MNQDICWYTLDDDFERVGLFPIQTTENGDYICPQCGKVTTYWEGIIAHNFVTSKDVRGWSYDCAACRITTLVEEFE